jgi:phasin
MTKNPMSYEIPNEMRDFAEKSVAQARKAIEGFMGAAQKATETLEGRTSSLQSDALGATRKVMSFAEQNMAASFDLAEKLVKARDPQEFMAIQAEFMKSQFQALQAQMKDVGEAAQARMKEAGAAVQAQVKEMGAAAEKAVNATRKGPKA